MTTGDANISMENMIKHAEEAMEQKDWPEAVKRWQKVFTAFKNSVPFQAYVLMSMSFRFQGDAKKAEKIIKQGLIQFPDNRLMLKECAEIAKAKKNMPEVISRLKKLGNVYESDLSHNWILQIKDKIKISVPADINNLTTYVLLEQEDWCEPEIDFIRKYIQPGMNCLDMDTGIGVYALVVANKMKGKGKFIAFNSGEYFEESVEINRLQDITTTELDDTPLDFIRLGDDKLNEKLLQQGDPLIMFPAKEGHIQFFKDQGLKIYQHNPALNILVPYIEGHISSNLFTCTPYRVTKLQDKELFATPLNYKVVPHLRWQDVMHTWPYTQGQMQKWKCLAIPSEYEIAINTFLSSLDQNIDKSTRYNLLRQSLELFTALQENGDDNLTTTLAQIRICSELGYRQKAATHSSQLLKDLGQGKTINVDRPFVPPISDYDERPVKENLGKWLSSATMEVFEMHRAYTSFHNPQGHIGVLKQACKFPDASIEMQRRLAICALNLGKNVNIQAESRLLSEEEQKKKRGELLSKSLKTNTNQAEVMPISSVHKIKNEKIVVYTAISGGYDNLKDPEFITPNIDYVCFTDNPHFQSKIWHIRELPELERNDLQAKMPKILPHKFFPDHQISVWINDNITIKSDLKHLITQALDRHNMALFRHPENRPSLEAEVQACIKLSKDDPQLLSSQLNAYKKEGFPLDQPVPAATIIMRRHHCLEIINTMQAWWEEINKYSYRDQISFPYVAWKNNFQYKIIDEYVRDNKWSKIEPHQKKKRHEQLKSAYTKADITFLSFPKSGRTWVRFFLGKYLEKNFEIPFSLEFPGNKNIPNIAFKHDYFQLNQDNPGKPTLLYPKLLLKKHIVIMVRDPRDVIVSYFHHKKNRENYLFKNIDEFIFSNIYGIERQSLFVLNLLDFYDNHPGPKFLLHYENLHSSPKQCFSDFIKFLLGSIVIDSLEYALEQTSFKKMQQSEVNIASGPQKVAHFGRLGVVNWDGNYDALKVRKGKVGAYFEEISMKTQETIMTLPATKQLIKKLNCIKPNLV